jgi:hypothetical protein
VVYLALILRSHPTRWVEEQGREQHLKRAFTGTPWRMTPCSKPTVSMPQLKGVAWTVPGAPASSQMAPGCAVATPRLHPHLCLLTQWQQLAFTHIIAKGHGGAARWCSGVAPFLCTPKRTSRAENREKEIYSARMKWPGTKTKIYGSETPPLETSTQKKLMHAANSTCTPCTLPIHPHRQNYSRSPLCSAPTSNLHIDCAAVTSLNTQQYDTQNNSVTQRVAGGRGEARLPV